MAEIKRILWVFTFYSHRTITRRSVTWGSRNNGGMHVPAETQRRRVKRRENQWRRFPPAVRLHSCSLRLSQRLCVSGGNRPLLSPRPQYVASDTRSTRGSAPKFRPQSVSSPFQIRDRKSTRLNSSHLGISY